MVKFQVLSDLHLEIHDAVFDFPKKAPFLILAGDVGDPSQETYKAFLHEQADRFDKVFVISGNHEYYGKTLDETNDLISGICSQREDLVFLNQTSYDLDDDHVILGTTLWSEMLDDQRSDLTCFMADFRKIKDWSFEKNNWQHAKEKAWLQSAIREVEKKEKLAIVVTHHAPSYHGTVAPKYKGDILSSGFCTDLESMMKLPVTCHMFGHTHFSCDKMFNGECRLVSNQLGYGDEETGFNPEFVVEVD